MANKSQKTTDAADLAVSFVIENPDETIREAAAMFGVTHQQVRGRINNKYGSLTSARNGHTTPRDRRSISKPDKWDRPCMRCGDTTPRDRGIYNCSRCSDHINKINDGAV